MELSVLFVVRIDFGNVSNFFFKDTLDMYLRFCEVSSRVFWSLWGLKFRGFLSCFETCFKWLFVRLTFASSGNVHALALMLTQKTIWCEALYARRLIISNDSAQNR